MIWVAVWAVFIFIVGWEILALATKEKYFPTWSRLTWWTIDAHPKLKWPIILGVGLLGVSITTWLMIHLSGECALGVC
jgi:hypothetical protein